jgi:hypothetical protein
MGAAMSRKILGAGAILWLAMLPAAVAGQDIFAPPTAPPQTRDRLSQDRMDELVSGPIDVVQSQGLAAGQAAFERLLARTRAAHGTASVEVADLIESFGVGLYVLELDSGEGFREASIPYLEAAIPAYRAAFGDADPEVAVALNSYADALSALNEDDPPRSAEAAYDEAYRIRLAAFGPRNVETMASLRYLARLRGLPSWTRGDRARIEAAAALFRRLIADSPDDQRLGRESGPYVRTALARLYARNGLAAEAREQLRLGIEHTRGWEASDRCIFAATETADVEEILAGKASGRGESLLNLDAVARCSEFEDDPPRDQSPISTTT